jgi:hypothetical protein
MVKIAKEGHVRINPNSCQISVVPHHDIRSHQEYTILPPLYPFSRAQFEALRSPNIWSIPSDSQSLEEVGHFPNYGEYSNASPHRLHFLMFFVTRLPHWQWGPERTTLNQRTRLTLRVSGQERGSMTKSLIYMDHYCRTHSMSMLNVFYF